MEVETTMLTFFVGGEGEGSRAPRFVEPWAELGTGGIFASCKCKRTFFCISQMKSEFSFGQIKPKMPIRHPK